VLVSPKRHPALVERTRDDETGVTMKRRLIAGAAALALFATAASPAFADQGSPGSTFPEQPGANPDTGCAAVLANTGTGISNDSDTAFAIQTGLILDACLVVG
jgi:hypothetical protein